MKRLLVATAIASIVLGQSAAWATGFFDVFVEIDIRDIKIEKDNNGQVITDIMIATDTNLGVQSNLIRGAEPNGVRPIYHELDVYTGADNSIPY